MGSADIQTVCGIQTVEVTVVHTAPLERVELRLNGRLLEHTRRGRTRPARHHRAPHLSRPS